MAKTNTKRNKKYSVVLLALLVSLAALALMAFAMESASAGDSAGVTASLKTKMESASAGDSAGVTVSVKVQPVIQVVGGTVKSNVPVTTVMCSGTVTYIWSH